MESTQSGTKTYLAIWGWLAGLMLLGVGLSELPISKAAVVVIVLALSSVKALLVALYYMHLKVDRRLLAFVAVTPLALIALAIGLLYSSVLVRL